MKTIMYNDRYDLTYAVIKRDKKQTRRIEKSLSGIENAYDDLGFTRFEYKTDGKCWLWNDKTNTFLEYVPRYKIGEVVAVAQSYEDCGEFDVYEAPIGTPGWRNKMFVKARLMPHQIRITGVRIERLQDISEEDCLKEGIQAGRLGFYGYSDNNGFARCAFINAREAYSHLIDDVSGKGTWQTNPFVWVYDFELIK